MNTNLQTGRVQRALSGHGKITALCVPAEITSCEIPSQDKTQQRSAPSLLLFPHLLSFTLFAHPASVMDVCLRKLCV